MQALVLNFRLILPILFIANPVGKVQSQKAKCKSKYREPIQPEKNTFKSHFEKAKIVQNYPIHTWHVNLILVLLYNLIFFYPFQSTTWWSSKSQHGIHYTSSTWRKLLRQLSQLTWRVRPRRWPPRGPEGPSKWAFGSPEPCRTQSAGCSRDLELWAETRLSGSARTEPWTFGWCLRSENSRLGILEFVNFIYLFLW